MYTYNECSNDDTYNIQIIYSLLHSPASFFTDNQSEKHYIFHCYYLIFNKQDEFVKWWQSHGGVYQWPWLWVTMLTETLTFIFFLTLSFVFFFAIQNFLKCMFFKVFQHYQSRYFHVVCNSKSECLSLVVYLNMTIKLEVV